jgi:hypothetical protein
LRRRSRRLAKEYVEETTSIGRSFITFCWFDDDCYIDTFTAPDITTEVIDSVLAGALE